MKTTLHKYQTDGIEFAIERRYSLNTSIMGSGKSVTALGVAERVGGHTVIVCPAFLVDNWKNEITKHLGEFYLGLFEIVPYSQLSNGRFRLKTTPTTMIVDEFHYCKTPSTKRTKALFSILRETKPKYFIGLTGTPIKNRVQEFYTLLSAVSLGNDSLNVNQYFKSHTAFCERYCYSRLISLPQVTYKEFYGFREDRREEFMELLKGKIYRVSGDDAGLSLPPIMHQEVFTKIEEPEGFSQEYENFILGGRSIIAKAASAKLKAEFTGEYVSNLIDQVGTPIVVFTDHVQSAEAIAHRFKVEPITGKTQSSRRIQIAEKSKVIVATIGAFSVGVNLTKANHLVFNDISWVPADNEQALKRIHRIGQERACTIHYVVGGHVDKFILDKVRSKMKIINSVTEVT